MTPGMNRRGAVSGSIGLRDREAMETHHRRQFIAQAAKSLLGVGCAGLVTHRGMQQVAWAAEKATEGKAKSVIFLYMSGSDEPSRFLRSQTGHREPRRYQANPDACPRSHHFGPTPEAGLFDERHCFDSFDDHRDWRA